MCICEHVCTHVYLLYIKAEAHLVSKSNYSFTANPGKIQSTLDLTVYRTNDTAFFIRTAARKRSYGGITCSPSTRETEAGKPRVPGQPRGQSK